MKASRAQPALEFYQAILISRYQPNGLLTRAICGVWKSHAI